MDTSTPQKLERLSNIQAIAAGANHSLVLDQSNEVQAWGNNELGQLGGLPTATVFQAEPNTVTDAATAIASGTNHSYAVVRGTLIGWGSNAFGQIGLSVNTQIEIPKIVLKNIAQP